jgi:hypothetical protein
MKRFHMQFFPFPSSPLNIFLRSLHFFISVRDKISPSFKKVDKIILPYFNLNIYDSKWKDNRLVRMIASLRLCSYLLHERNVDPLKLLINTLTLPH